MICVLNFKWHHTVYIVLNLFILIITFNFIYFCHLSRYMFHSYFGLNALKEKPRKKKSLFIPEQLYVPVCFCLSLIERLKSGGFLGRREA